MIAEVRRLAEDSAREQNWKRWGPYLAERQWATVREDYSPDGTVWDYFPHEHARSRAYRWGEDGLLGITDRECRLCFALALWNGKDPILKERLFGLTGPQGNHGEDVKENYFYLDSTLTHSYLKALYKYPQAEFPYNRLLEENRRRGYNESEFELSDTGIFDGNRYFDVLAEYAKAGPDDIQIRITIANHGPEQAPLHVLPTLWYRNTWSWGTRHLGRAARPSITAIGRGLLRAEHVTLGRSWLTAGPGPDGKAPQFLLTENETNTLALFDSENRTPYVKDAFHAFLIQGRTEAVNPAQAGTKAAALYRLEIPAGEEVTLRLRLTTEAQVVEPASRLPGGGPALGSSNAGQTPLAAGEMPAPLSELSFEQVFRDRIREADEFYAERLPTGLSEDEARVVRQADAGLLWNKQFYHYNVRDWLEGDPQQPPAPAARVSGRNADWHHLDNRDVISMPDKWEYPWYAAWDLAFHMIPFTRIDPAYAKSQLVLFLREWYMHPNGQLPAYEFNFADVNPPVHAWSCWRVYKMTAARGHRDRVFLSRCFQKLVINFTWWVNRKDLEGHNLFAGGFLGLDNELIQGLRGFKKRMDWFLENRPELNDLISYCCLLDQGKGRCLRLLAIPTRTQLERVLRYVLDEKEFLSPYGIRSLSRIHKDQPYIFRLNGEEYRVDYEPGESLTQFFGGNSNWRGPVWLPLNYLLIEALERYHYYYGDGLQVECPTGSGKQLNLQQVASELRSRPARLFLRDAQGRRPCHGADRRFAEDPHWRDLLLFHEYFHAETGRGLGASHQTGWTALVTRLLEGKA
jgi:hypothetical protein